MFPSKTTAHEFKSLGDKGRCECADFHVLPQSREPGSDEINQSNLCMITSQLLSKGSSPKNQKCTFLSVLEVLFNSLDCFGLGSSVGEIFGPKLRHRPQDERFHRNGVRNLHLLMDQRLGLCDRVGCQQLVKFSKL